MYALVDCNNFFASCERAFQPQLEGRPVVVLSNNDGCVVARSNEAKALEIKMGTPFFKLKNLVDSGRLNVRSSNYALYGDMSARVMNILRSAVPKIEVYSIDESFLSLDGISPADQVPMCLSLVRQIRQWTGIPVSIGIAPTKTLGKMASHFAKRYPGYHGVCVIDSEEKRIKALKLTSIDDVWGIGWRGAPKLMTMGVLTAYDLTARPLEWVQKHLGITGVRTWKELQGTPAVQDEKEDRRQTICTSRSFANLISDKDELSMRVCDFAGVCAHKLRKENSIACKVGVFIHTSRFRTELPQYYPYGEHVLGDPGSSTQVIVSAAMKAFDKIYKPGYGYKRAGVIMEDIIPAGDAETSLFTTESELSMKAREDKVSELMDKFNSPGSNLLRLGSQRAGHYSDGIRREHCSSLFTTDWEQLLQIH